MSQKIPLTPCRIDSYWCNVIATMIIIKSFNKNSNLKMKAKKSRSVQGPLKEQRYGRISTMYALQYYLHGPTELFVINLMTDCLKFS